MTCGAAGGMNVILKTILEPGEEVIVVKPYFAEYGFYISNHQGVMITVDSNEDFSLNIENIEKAIQKLKQQEEKLVELYLSSSLDVETINRKNEMILHNDDRIQLRNRFAYAQK